ncbi:VPLPA-CTERM protein sorting domain-containing protein [Lutimaribacter pacificus]|uniref:VPLPA-CTERM protein sorting domain-containing protein n=1 Tax=Lutimaribacter pacificus TaxID=391948 RepID=A0A1H0L9F7_9RHOB|nr:choice-of-anchor K domain-containing protein [Lutimaribacter pacificus]SDO64837.1 VPLPA-CTERM protein sorting domain-containing protein [Lutimaribacter pacificus]SHK69739.1 VPLPA-CTERM protein sorting domain-containing protein [Lutimaribacter pacificus]
MKMSILTCAFLLATAAASHAATFTGSAQGAWTSVDGSFGHTVANNGDSASVTWGVEWVSSVPETDEAIATYIGETDPDSNHMSFTSGANWTTDGGIFSLGSFEYRNGLSYAASHDFLGANLTIDVALSDPAVGDILSFDYAFDVLTTTNNNVSVPDDADTLHVQQAPAVQYFMVGGQRYMFEILGLSSDGGATFSDEFVVYEAWHSGAWHDIDPARADIYARISPTVVPVPATLPLLLSAVGAVGYVSRRKRKAA